MKEIILKLREEGKSYREIMKITGCSSATVSYHCGKGQKDKNYERGKKRKKTNTLVAKIDRFKSRNLSEKSRSFQRREGSKITPRKEYNFNLEDIINKIGENPVCYLSGRRIQLENPKSFHFDHIIPASKGGTNSLENVGLLEASVNKMKHDLTVEEFISKCKEILEYQGYKIIKEN